MSNALALTLKGLRDATAVQEEKSMITMDAVPSRLWHDVAAFCDYATFFHTEEWTRILEEAYPGKYRGAAKAFSFDGGKNWAVLPLMAYGSDCRGFFYRLVSMPFGVYGGHIASFNPSPEQLARMYRSISGWRMRVREMHVFGNPYAHAEPVLKGWKKEENFTHRLDLGKFQGEEDLLKAYAHCVRNHLNRARTQDFLFKKADSLEEVGEFFNLYQESRSRWKAEGKKVTNNYPVELFRAILLARSGKAVLWLLKKDGRLLGGLQCFSHNGHWVAWHSAFDEEGFKLGAAKQLHHLAILEAKRQGFRTYDFNPSGEHAGSAKFKEYFGAERVPFHTYCLL